MIIAPHSSAILALLMTALIVSCSQPIAKDETSQENFVYSSDFSARANAVIAAKGMKPGDGSEVWKDDDGCYWYYIPPTKPTFEGISFELFDREKDEWICD
jgi:hypothetical protein